jgi:hypothetical protein
LQRPRTPYEGEAIHGSASCGTELPFGPLAEKVRLRGETGRLFGCRRGPSLTDCVEKPTFGGAMVWFVMKGDVVVAAFGPSGGGGQLRDRDELGELPEVLSGGGEEELVLGAAGTS